MNWFKHQHCILQYVFLKNYQQFHHVLGRMEHLESLTWEDLQVQLAIGLLAGNVFDWGAKEVALLMEESALVRKPFFMCQF